MWGGEAEPVIGPATSGRTRWLAMTGLAMRGEAKAAGLEAAPEGHRRRFAADTRIDVAPMELIAIGDAAAA